MIGINDLIKKIGIEPEFIIKLEYRKALSYLMALILKAEKSLIQVQEVDGLEIISPRQKSIQHSLKVLTFSYNKIAEMEGVIFMLRKENDLLKERIKNYDKN